MVDSGEIVLECRDAPRIFVDAYSGYRPNERPRYFTVDEDIYEIAGVEDQWRSPDAAFFKVRSTEGKRYVLRYDEHER